MARRLGREFHFLLRHEPDRIAFADPDIGRRAGTVARRDVGPVAAQQFEVHADVTLIAAAALFAAALVFVRRLSERRCARVERERTRGDQEQEGPTSFAVLHVHSPSSVVFRSAACVSGTAAAAMYRDSPWRPRP